MVYESDFYTTRRPYRTTPSYSTYTSSSVPSRQVRILPGLGKVHIIHTYNRIVPYVGHKRLTVVTSPPKVYSTRPSVLHREYDWIENKVRPWVSYSATNNYLNSNSAVRITYQSYPYTIKSSSLVTSRYWPSSTYNWPYHYRNYWPLYYNFRSNINLFPLYRYRWNSYFDDYWYNRYLDHLCSYPSIARYEIVSSVSKPNYWSYYWPYYSYKYNYYPKRMVYLRSPITGLYYSRYSPYTAYTNYYRINRPIYSYDYWPYSDYYFKWWPNYRFDVDLDEVVPNRALRLQRIFDDQTRAIRAKTASLLKQVHLPVPRQRVYSYLTGVPYRYEEYPARLSNDNYIHRLLSISPKSSKVEFVTYYTEPVKKYIGQGHLSCTSYVGDRGHARRRNVYIYEDPVKNDIQLLSFYINKFREEKLQKQIEPSKAILSPSRPSRKFNSKTQLEDNTSREIEELREARAARLAKIHSTEEVNHKSVEDDQMLKKKQEEARLAEEKIIAEEQAAKKAAAKKEEEEKRKDEERKIEAARRAELARQEELAAQAAAEKAAELERQAELIRKEELAKQAEIEKAKAAEEERRRIEEEKRLAEEIRLEEERRQLEQERIRLEEIARQAEEDKEAELARQAEELAELARQEAELAEQAQREAEEAELARQEEENSKIEEDEEELAELERRDREINERFEKAKIEAEAAERDAQLAREEKEEDENEPEEDGQIQEHDQLQENPVVSENEDDAEYEQVDREKASGEVLKDDDEPVAEVENNPNLSTNEDTEEEAEEVEDEEE